MDGSSRFATEQVHTAAKVYGNGSQSFRVGAIQLRPRASSNQAQSSFEFRPQLIELIPGGMQKGGIVAKPAWLCLGVVTIRSCDTHGNRYNFGLRGGGREHCGQGGAIGDQDNFPDRI
jgi:hypothetical protein